MNTTRILAAAFATSIGLSGAAFAQAKLQLIDPPSTVQAAPEASAKAATTERGFVRSRVATPNWGTLQQLRETLRANPENAVSIDVPMFADTTLALVIDQAEVEPTRGTTTYYGHADGDPLQSAVIVESNGSFALHVVRGQRAFQVTLRGDHHEAAEVDRGEFTNRPDIDRAPPAGHPHPGGAKAAADATPAAAADDGSIIDLMVVYSDRARLAAGSTAAIENQIALAVGTTNQAYVNSGMVQRLRLVHTEEIANSESPDMGTTLDAITNGTAPFQGVNALRTQYGADMVSMWVANGGQYCGIGWVMDTVGSSFAPYAYNVNERNCAVSGGTMAHELGHNMGLEHDLYVSPEGPNHPVAQRYAHGYVNTAQRFRTIMAYQDACDAVGVSCPRINQFSDPGFTFNGAATGNATTADASRMLDETRVTVANFRPSASAPPPSPTIAFAQSTYSVSEGTAQVTLVVGRSGSTAGTSTVAWTTANGSATAGSDFGTAGSSAQRSGTLTFAAGETSKTITVPIINNTVVESNETFTVTLSSPSGGVLGLATATVTIIDNDTVTAPPPPPPPPVASGLQFQTSAVTVSEGTPTVVLTVIRTGSITPPASVRWTTANGSAVVGQDFGTRGRATQSAGTLSWRANDGAAKTISIPIIDDTVAEPTETFTVSLSGASAGLTLGTPSTATVTITDNDGTSTPVATELRFSLTRYQVVENAGSVVLTVNRVNLGGGFGAAASVSYATQASTALAGSDFVATSGTLSWAPGDSASKTITIPIVNNALSEGSEIFNVLLSGASSSTRIGTPSVQVLILDDESRTR